LSETTPRQRDDSDYRENEQRPVCLCVQTFHRFFFLKQAKVFDEGDRIANCRRELLRGPPQII